MNKPTVAEKIEVITKLVPSEAREPLARVLREAAFTDPDDPALCAIHAHVIVGSQPLKLHTTEGARVATASDMARLGDRVEQSIWEGTSLKLRNFLIMFGSTLLIGGGLALGALHFWPSSVCQIAGVAPVEIPVRVEVPVKDERLESLEEIGAHLRLKSTEKGTYVYFNPDEPQPKSGTNQAGISYLFFAK